MMRTEKVIVEEYNNIWVNEFQKSNYTENDIDSFYMQEKIEDKKGFFNFFKAHNIYDYCTIIDGA